MLRVFLTVISMLAVLTTASGQVAAYDGSEAVPVEQGRDSSKMERFILHYRVNETELDETYMSNREQLHKIRHYFTHSPRIDSVTIYSWASPEGGIKFNTYLSRERGRTAKDLLLSLSPDSAKFNSGKIKLSPVAENWEGLEKLVEERYFRHDRDKVLKILRAKDIGDETRKWRLQQLNEGYTWKILIRRYMPELRAATWICVWAEVIDPLPEVAAIVAQAMAEEHAVAEEEAAIALPTESYGPMERTIFALKTNMLYDAVSAVNFALEVPFNERFSVLYEHHCPWWLSSDNKRCLQFLSFGAEARWWFLPRPREATPDLKRRDALMGHFIGAYGWTGKSDIQWGRDFGCYQFEFCSAGLTYGFAFPLSKYINLELSLSAGYARIPYQHYIPTEDWQILIKDKNKAGTLHYFGPTKAEISLVIPFRKQIHGKGGAR